jgi:hypothetical protein
MSALSPLQINLSYQGLLKLADSTTGITQTVQSIQDGLGNDTGLKIGTNRLQGGNTMPWYKAGVGKYYGSGFGTTAANPSTNQNLLIAGYFYDNGVSSYSAVTVNCTTLHATDTCEVAFYDSQYIEGYGLQPYNKLAQLTITGTTTTGLKTMVLASPLTFSGQGPGLVFQVSKYISGGAPTIRLAASVYTPGTWRAFAINQTGFIFNTAGTAAFEPTQYIGTTNASSFVYNTGTFPTTWTSTQSALLTSSSASIFYPGVLLHTIR